MARKIVIIGAGPAGLAASVELVSAGFQVTLIEQRRYAGGRASSFIDRKTGIELDNGQHVLMGCYHNTLRFLRKIGTFDKLFIQDNLQVDFINGNGALYSFQCHPLPAPFHVISGILSFSALPFPKRLKMLKVAKDILQKKDYLSNDYSVDRWLARHSQDRESKEKFWNILTYAMMNESPEYTSSLLFKNVLRKALLSSRKGSRLIIPTVPLNRLYVENAEAYIMKNGGTIEKGISASELLIEDNSISGVRLSSGEIIKGDYYICAIPFYSLEKIIPEKIFERFSYFKELRKLKTSPILSIHLMFDQPVMDYPFVALIDSPIQWIFNRRLIFKNQKDNILSLVTSGAHSYLKWTGKKLLHMAMSELTKTLNNITSARLIFHKIIKERSATFTPFPGIEKYRPSHTTPISNLCLAGDWTATGLPATIEGAVSSGYGCAEIIKSFCNP